MTPVHAIRALRWNYRWRGVLRILRADCTIHGRPPLRGRGWWLVLRHPRAVVSWQMALAEGVTA